MQSVSLIVIVAESYNIAGLVSGLLGMVLLLLIASFVVVIGGRHCYLRRYVFCYTFLQLLQVYFLFMQGKKTFLYIMKSTWKCITLTHRIFSML